MASLIGKWTTPGVPVPSSHLVARFQPREWVVDRMLVTRCGRVFDNSAFQGHAADEEYTDEPPANGKTCERCLVLSRRDS